ncbi:MAG: hypothetical protein JF888_09005 [Candidatus Dormibacteraeota bacterium]|uniref:Uncharacterized protein n=1 Tax=Candidatus Dormiibacter inghamiae TaxID=3127013 RepID=A0A934KEK8_9BACT|nr:hypothetical protein [Candidatus Dormibacteraeota bacterium]MBJ7606512.1 hypothetical protein [Candidatus Dormibacteraeota bacterium]
MRFGYAACPSAVHLYLKLVRSGVNWSFGAGDLSFFDERVHMSTHDRGDLVAAGVVVDQ